MATPNKKILIVEDDSSFLWLLKQGLANEDFSVISAEDGEKGLKMIEEEKPDLILLDIMLPKMDGISVAKNLKEKKIGSHIIFLTNLNDTIHISQAVEISRETEYIVKSDLHIDQIVARVKEKLGIK